MVCQYLIKISDVFNQVVQSLKLAPISLMFQMSLLFNIAMKIA